jgi:putative PIN family toxin of toxin-antitoxin system
VLKVVLDAVVFVRALLNPKSRSGRLLPDYSDRFKIIVSRPTAQELLEVINRPELKAKYRSLGRIDSGTVIDLLSRAEAVEIGDLPSIVRDLKTISLSPTARAGRADYIVSEDKDLLVLDKTAGIPVIDSHALIGLIETER